MNNFSPNDCNYLSTRSNTPYITHYKSTGDLCETASASSSVPTSPKAYTQHPNHVTSDSFMLGTPPRSTELRVNFYQQRPNRRSTTILQLSPKTTEPPPIDCSSVSLADIQQLHASFNRNYQQTQNVSIEEEEEDECLSQSLFHPNSMPCRQKQRPMFCLETSFKSSSFSSSTENENNDQSVEENKQAERKNAIVFNSVPNRKIPNFKVQPASPSIERSALKWTSQPKPYRKMSDMTKLSTDDEEYCGGRRRSISKSPTRALDQIVLEKLNSPTQTEQPQENNNNNILNLESNNKGSFYKFPSLRKKKNSLKSKDSINSHQERPNLLKKRLSNAQLFDSKEGLSKLFENFD